MAGLTISASTSLAHDFFTNVFLHDKEHQPGEEVKVTRITAFVVGLLAIGIAISPDFMQNPLFPLKNPAIASIPIESTAAIIGTLLGKNEPYAIPRFAELQVRGNTGLDAEKSSEH